MSELPVDPMDPDYESGLRAAHALGDDENAVTQFMAGFAEELSHRRGQTDAEQLRELNRSVVRLAAFRLRAANFTNESVAVVESQLGVPLMAAYRAWAKQQGQAAPPGK